MQRVRTHSWKSWHHGSVVIGLSPFSTSAGFPLMQLSSPSASSWTCYLRLRSGLGQKESALVDRARF